MAQGSPPRFPNQDLTVSGGHRPVALPFNNESHVLKTGQSSKRLGAESTSRSPNHDLRATDAERLVTLPSKIEPFVPKTDHNPKDLKFWAQRTGFNFSAESEANKLKEIDTIDLEKGNVGQKNGSSPNIEIESILGQRTQNGSSEIEPKSVTVGGHPQTDTKTNVDPLQMFELGDLEKGSKVEPLAGSDASELGGKSNGGWAPSSDGRKNSGRDNREVVLGMFPASPKLEPLSDKSLRLICGLTDNPGPVFLVFYGLQHFLSLAGSLVLIPLITVPAMGGTDEETSIVISTMLLMCGFSTILHLIFGTRLPLVQGSSFVYLAPALVIINSQDFRNLNGDRFKYTMRELQGAVVVGSLFQIICGCSGIMSLLLRFITPVVVASTVVAMGLAFFSYAFPLAGTCIEISIPDICLLILFAMYLRGIHIAGYEVFQIYAVPLSLSLVWAYAFFLTAGGAYEYKGCSYNIPSSNIVDYACKNHIFTMKHCRTDASNAWEMASWIRVPYPFQWGIPSFHFRTIMIMVAASVVASVDSIGSYHAASLLVNLRPPSPAVVGRGICVEGLCSVLAGLWGTGTGCATLGESRHTITSTKMANRKSLILGASILVLLSFIGKIGAILASIPQALALSTLCFVWALMAAVGLSTLHNSKAPSFRNMMIFGFSLFISLSLPAYIQQYEPLNRLVVPSYFLPYAAASSGPVSTRNSSVNYALNGILSLNMIISLLVALILDNTVPGSKEERETYMWPTACDPSLTDYALPDKVGTLFHWAKCLTG